MTRLCFLVVDPEHAGSISSRKLVLETAKFNVITAYSCAEAAETLERFPNVNGVVLNAAMPDESCRAFLQGVGARHPHVPRIVVGEPREADIPAELFVQGFAPAVLLDRLQGLYPAEFEAIEQQEERLRD